MMRRALEEDQYSALGSVVDTDSSDDDGGGGEDEDDYYQSSIRWNHRPKRNSSSGDAGSKNQPWMNNNKGTTTQKVDRNTIMIAMRKHLRLEGMKSVRNFDGTAFMEDAEEYLVRGGSGSSNKRSRSLSPRPSSTNNNVGGGGGGEEEEEEDLAVDGRRIGKRRKKKKKGGKVGAAASSFSGQLSDVPNESGTGGVDTPMSGSGNDDGGGGDWEDGKDDSCGGAAAAKDANEDFIPEKEEISIFGQTAGASNATWVECDRCKKVCL